MTFLYADPGIFTRDKGGGGVNSPGPTAEKKL